MASVSNEQTAVQTKREIVGTVTSNKMQKTITVTVDRSVRHKLYKKYITRSKKFKAHDEHNTAHEGDLVLLVESRPLSKQKRFALKTILRRAAGTDQVTEA